MYGNMDKARPGTLSLATSNTTHFYRWFEWSTLRNLNALELLEYLAIEWSVPESLYLHVHTGVWCPLASCFWYLAWLACLLWSPAGYAVKTLFLLLWEKLQLSPPQKLPVSFVFLRSAAHYLPRIWDHKLVSDVFAPPDFRQC